MRTFFVLLLLLIQGVSDRAFAQPIAAVSAAREHYRKATTLFDLSRYAEAAKEFALAYEAKPDPALLFNLAQSHRLAGSSVAALQAYKAYLRRMPASPNRAEVETRIAELQQKIAASQEAAESATGSLTSAAEASAKPPLPPKAAADVPIALPTPTPTLVEATAKAPTPRRAPPRWVWGAVAGSVVLVGAVFGLGLGLHYADRGARSPSIGVGGLE